MAVMIEPSSSIVTVPKYLYRYYSLSDEKSLGRIREVLLERKIFFPSPASFNDPFDCKVDPLSFDGTKAEWEDKLKGIIKSLEPAWNRKMRKTWVKENMKGDIHTKIDIDSVKKNIQERINEHGMLCLSSVSNNLLMWSHYSNGHRGICLEFLHINDFFGVAQEVIYRDEYPTVNALSRPEDLDIKGLLFTKANCWAYEKEWRLFELRAANTHFVFPQGVLTGIFWGCRIKGEHKKIISAWATQINNPPSIFQAVTAAGQFGIVFNPIEVKINNMVIIPAENRSNGH